MFGFKGVVLFNLTMKEYKAMSMDKKKKVLIAASIAGIMAASGAAFTAQARAATGELENCYGVNACKGMGACGGCARGGGAYGLGDFFSENHDPRDVLVRQIKKSVYLLFWNYQCMAGIQRFYFEKRKKPGVFEDFMARQLAVYNLSKNRGHFSAP